MGLLDYNTEKPEQNLPVRDEQSQRYLDAGRAIVAERVAGYEHPDILTSNITDDDYIEMGRESLKEREGGFLKGVVRDIASGIPALGKLAGHAIKTIDPEGGIDVVDRFGQKIIDVSGRMAETGIMRPREAMDEGFVERGIRGGLQSTVPSLGPMFAGAGAGAAVGSVVPGIGTAIGGIIGGAAATLGVHGLGVYGQKKEEYLQQGIDEKTAHKAAVQQGLVEGGIETVSNIVGMLTFGWGKLASQPLKQTAKELLKTPVKTFAKNLTKNALLNEVPTEMLQGALGTKIDERIGLLPEGAWQEAAVESIIPALTMSILFGLGAQGATSLQRNHVKKQLNSANPEERVKAAEYIAKNIDDKELRQAWINHVTPLINEGASIDINADFTQVISGEVDQVKVDIKSGLIPEGIKSGDLALEDMAPVIERVATQDPALAKQITDMFAVKETDLAENERRFKEDPLDAENNAEYLDKYIKRAALPEAEALTTEELTKERARVFEEVPRKPAEISVEAFEKEITEEERIRAKVEIEPDINKFLRRAMPEEIEKAEIEGRDLQAEEEQLRLLKGLPKADAVEMAEQWNKMWATGTEAAKDARMVEAKTLIKARPDLFELVNGRLVSKAAEIIEVAAKKDREFALSEYEKAISLSSENRYRNAEKAARQALKAGIPIEQVIGDLRGAGYSDNSLTERMKASGYNQDEIKAGITAIDTEVKEVLEKPSKVRTLRGVINKLGGIDFQQFKGELETMDLSVKHLHKTTGRSIDLVEMQLKEDGWLYPDEELLDVLADAKNLSRDRIGKPIAEKKDYELSAEERRIKKEMEREPEAPPEGEYITLNAEDLPVGKKLTLIEGKTREGWDDYVVKEKDPFEITLVDGETITLSPLDKVQVLKKDLPAKKPEKLAKPLPPKLPETKLPEAAREPIKAEGIVEPTPEIEKEKIEVMPEKKELEKPIGVEANKEAYGSQEKADAAVESVAKDVQAVSDKRMPDRVRVAESKVTKELRSKKRVDFTGRKLTPGNESQEIAGMFQVYRSPKLEILHTIYTAEDGTILAHNAITSGQIDSVMPKDMAQYIYKMKSAAKRLEAAKVHVLHNHPAGDPTMSYADMRVAYKVNKELGIKMGEFIVIDHNKFTRVDKFEGVQGWTKEGSFKPLPTIRDWTEGKTQISSPEALAKFGKNLAYDKNKAVFIYLNSQNEVQGWTIHSKKFLFKSPILLRKSVQQQTKAHNAIRAVLIADNPILLKRIVMGKAVGEWLVDIQDAKGNSLREQFPSAFMVDKGVSKQAWGLFEPKVEYGKPTPEYTEMLKRYQGAHTTPLIDEAIDETKIKHFPSLEKKGTQPVWIKEKFGRTEKTLTDKIGDNVGAFRKNWQTRLLDKLHPIKALGETAYMLHRLETGSQATMSMFMRHGKLRWKGKALTVDTQKQGFMPWLDSLGDDAQKLFYWMAAKRAEVLETEGREKWLGSDTRKNIYDWVGDKPKSAKSWKVLNDQFQEFNKSVLDLAQQSGLINAGRRAAWEQEFYVPFYRIFEDGIAKEEFLKGPLMSKKHISTQIKRLTGAEMKIGDPLENIIRNWSHLIHESVRNTARAEAYNFAQKNNMKAGITDDSGNLLPLIETVKASDLNIYRSDKEKRMVYVTKKGDDNILSFQKNGHKVYFKVNDAELFNALSDVNHRQFNGFLIRAFGHAKRWLTYGATFGPAFKVANMLRDTLHTAIISKSFIPFIDSGKGIVKALKEDADYVKFMASGAGFGSSYIRAENPKALAEYINRIVKKEGEGAARRILDTPKKMLDFWEKLGAASENAARVQLYTKRIAEGETHLKAAFEGRDLMDFTMRGDSQVVQYLIRTVPFMNARAQGLYKLGRAAKQDPKSFMIKGSILTIATFALWAMNRDKDEWKELEDWDKRTYYHFWIGDKHYRIPKPFETGAIFSTMFEGMAETMAGDEEFGYFVDVMKDTFLDTFAMNPLPQAIRPLIEQWSNKSFFTGRPIEGQSLQRLRPGERKTAWTSETMQLAGKLGVSPKRAEEIIRGYFSTFGMFLLGTSDIFAYHLADFPTNPTKEINDYPLLGRFIKERVPARHTKYQTKFYEMFREVDQLVATVNNHRRLGNYKEAAILATKERKAFIKRKGLLKVRKELTEINANLRRTMASRILTAEQKRTKIDGLIERKNQATQQIYERYLEQ